MKPSILDYMCHYIPYPEKWLIRTGLMEIIKSEHYQMQLVYYITSITHCAKGTCWDSDELFWSQTLLSTRNWLEHMLYSDIEEDKDVKMWQEKIQCAISTLSNEENQHDVRDWVLYWIAHCSLLNALVAKRIKITL